MLLERASMPAFDAIGHVLGLQAQAPLPPYIALWSRLARFHADELSQLVESRAVVRMAAMRGTVFAMTAADAALLRPFVQPLLSRDLETNPQHREGLVDLDRAALVAAVRALLAERPLSQAELRPLLAERFPDRPPAALAHAARGLLPLVQVPPRGLWRRSGQPRLAVFDDWTGRPLDDAPSPDAIVWRYLAAYGPATPADAQAWCGLTGLREVFERLRPRLQVFRTETGAEVFDLPDAPRPDPGTPAPVRILAPYDNVLFAHRDRTRVVADEYRKAMATPNGLAPLTVLVDGTVAAVAHAEEDGQAATLDVRPFVRLPVRVRDRVEAEGRRLLRFRFPDAQSVEVRTGEPSS
ncbi:winged helix DNA-binding domain-containing protein [Rhodococcus sp. HNM0569]|nr:winged helix DNA-binding domain-containing protein [Rhodococcus sp. HNM0569]